MLRRQDVGRFVGRSGDDLVGEESSDVRPHGQASGTESGPDEEAGEVADRADRGPSGAGERAESDPGLHEGGVGQSRRPTDRCGEDLPLSADRDGRVEPGPGLPGRAAQHPPVIERDEVVGAGRLHDGPVVGRRCAAVGAGHLEVDDLALLRLDVDHHVVGCEQGGGPRPAGEDHDVGVDQSSVGVDAPNPVVVDDEFDLGDDRVEVRAAEERSGEAPAVEPGGTGDPESVVVVAEEGEAFSCFGGGDPSDVTGVAVGGRATPDTSLEVIEFGVVGGECDRPDTSVTRVGLTEFGKSVDESGGGARPGAVEVDVVGVGRGGGPRADDAGSGEGGLPGVGAVDEGDVDAAFAEMERRRRSDDPGTDDDDSHPSSLSQAPRPG